VRIGRPLATHTAHRSLQWRGALDGRHRHRRPDIPSVPGLVEHFKPKLRYLLIDENAYSDHQLATVKNLVAVIFRIEQNARPETIDHYWLRFKIGWPTSRNCVARLLFGCAQP
jgi:hypothetical protein